MKYYIDITLLPDAETGLGFIWKKVFQQVHIALADNKVGANESPIAISIVGYGDKVFPLGNKLRLLAVSQEVLASLNIGQWLARLADYCHVTTIKEVPSNISQYAQFKRQQVKSIYKKAQSRAAHLNKTYDETLAFLLKNSDDVACRLPFVRVESQQAQQAGQDKNQFPLFIERTLLSEATVGKFDCYGLSKTATVPWF